MYFGETPKVPLNYPKFTFNRIETLDEITLKLTDGSVHNIKIEPSSKIQFNDDPEDYCFTRNILSQFEKLFLHNCEKSMDHIYTNDNPDESILKQMIIKMGKKFIVLDEKDFLDEYNFVEKKIYIHSTPCNINTLGVKFLRLFDLYEFDYSEPNEVVNLYQKRN